MSAVVEHPAPTPPTSEPPTPSAGGLLRAELLRFRSRRFIQVLLGLAAVAWVLATVIGLLSFSTPTPADLASAQEQLQQEVERSEQFREECLEDPNLPSDMTPEEACGPPMTAEDFELAWFLDVEPFVLADAGPGGAVGVAALAAAFAFVVGATWIGAEWSNRTIVALLFWVPRRLRVIGAKLAVLVGAAALFGVLAQAAWMATSGILDAAAGTDAPLPDGFWGDLLQTQARGVLLVVIAALLGFGLTNLIRNTGAALGVAFVYMAILENLVRALRPYWDPFLLTSNALGLVQQGGYTIYIWDDANINPDGSVEQVEYYLGHLQSGVLLTVVTVLIVGVGTWLFAKRDLH